MKKIAIYGKGGSGKSMIASNLSAWYAKSGLRTLQVGCDPKHDSTLSLMGGKSIPTVISLLDQRTEGDIRLEEIVGIGAHGVTCLETGGPEAGVGCAGRGIISMSKIVRRLGLFEQYDVIVMDVLGDVVCGGFAVPLMQWAASTVAIVVSDNLMSMYAANNIARAIVRFSRNGTHLAGLIANDVREMHRVKEIESFAGQIGTRLLCVLPHDPAVRTAERHRSLVLDFDPECEVSRCIPALARELLTADIETCNVPKPMSDRALEEFFSHMET